MKLTADYLVGRRFRFTVGRNVPDFTCTGYDPEKGIRVHAIDGGKYWFALAYIRKALKAGVIVESEDAPFVLERGQYPSKAQQRRATAHQRITERQSVRAIIRRLHKELQQRHA